MSNVIYSIGGYNPPYSRVYEYREYKHDKMAYRTGYIISLAYIKTMSMTEKIAEKEKGTIEGIDERVYRIGKKNGLKLKDINFVDKVIKNTTTKGEKKPNYQIYKETKAKEPNNMTLGTANTQAVETLQKPTIQKTIAEIMTDLKLDSENILEFHRNLRDESEDDRIKLEANRDFIKIQKIMPKEGLNPPIVAIQVIGKVEKMEKQELDNTLSDLIEGEIIE